MSELSQLYLTKLSEQYETKGIPISETVFSLFLVSKKKPVCYLLFCDNCDTPPNLDSILEAVNRLDESHKYGNSYLCVMHKKDADKDMCTYFNGKSFVHFIFSDPPSGNLIYDTDFYYFGAKHIKRLIAIYQECFND